MIDGLWVALGGFALVALLALAGVALVAAYVARSRSVRRDRGDES